MAPHLPSLPGGVKLVSARVMPLLVASVRPQQGIDGTLAGLNQREFNGGPTYRHVGRARRTIKAY